MMPLEHYMALFSKLNTDRGNNWKLSVQTARQAPHKPILLLCVLDRFAQGSIHDNLIELDAELGELFHSYWSTVMPPGRRGEIAMPFYHLQRDGFWHLLWKPGEQPHGKVHSVTKLNELAYGARLDEELFHLIQVEGNRSILRELLLLKYFDETVRAALVEQSEVNVGAYLYGQAILNRATPAISESLAQFVTPEEQQKVRDQGFRKAVREAYAYTCAMTGMRVVTDDGHVAVVGAHIVPWSENQDDRITNGVALSPTCHWAFDEGLLSLTDSYTIKTSRQLHKGDNLPRYLNELEGRKLRLPQEKSFWPDPENLHWHRRHVFRRQ